jgi:hypothetical protein
MGPKKWTPTRHDEEPRSETTAYAKRKGSKRNETLARPQDTGKQVNQGSAGSKWNPLIATGQHETDKSR